MKTYAESKGEEKFNWFDALNDTPISDEDWDFLQEKAGLWTTCACGNLCDILPRGATGVPKDKELRELGCEFFSAISIRLSDVAQETLHKIELRSSQLIKELQSN